MAPERTQTQATAPLAAVGAVVLALLLSIPGGAVEPGNFWFIWRVLTFVLGAVGVTAVAAWYEARIYADLLRVRTALRLPALVLVVLGAFLLAALGVGTGALIAQLLPGFGLTFALVLGVGGLWLGFAALGGLVVSIAELLVNAVVADFRSRLLLIVIAVITLFGSLTGWLGVSAARVVNTIVDNDPMVLSGDLVGGRISAPHWALIKAEIVENVAVFGLVWVVFTSVPLLLSVASKIADSAMGPLRPLARAMQRLADGDLEVAVAERGSADVITLTENFNAMVRSLRLSQQMERAFGAYVSGPVLRQIKSQHGRAALDARLRDATVFFSDIRGFTSLSEQLTPQETLDLLNLHFGQIIPIVDEHEGYLDKFIGDALIVVFNGPIDQEDHATRAVNCAIAIQQRMSELNAQGFFGDTPLSVGIGVATGPLVAGTLGSSAHLEFTVIGDTVNLAARLTSDAPGGEVWVSASTATMLPESLLQLGLGPVSVRGRSQQDHPWRVWPRMARQSVPVEHTVDEEPHG